VFKFFFFLFFSFFTFFLSFFSEFLINFGILFLAVTVVPSLEWLPVGRPGRQFLGVRWLVCDIQRHHMEGSGAAGYVLGFLQGL
jgi:hypothetical protein